MAQRFSFLIFMALAIALIVIGRVQPVLINNARVHAVDTVMPVLQGLTRPITAAANTLADMKGYLSLREENEKLRADTTQIKEWQNAVANLEKENHELRTLLHFKTEPRLAYISARVIADTGGPFARGLIVTAGKLDGVSEGMAALTGDGLIGRVIEAGDWSSRILLITDLNSRIPVTISGSGERAILTGDNSATPRLAYLPQDAVLNMGVNVVTSGHGGVFPPNLPVGTVTENSGMYKVIPIADLGHIDYVRLVDFSLNGGKFNPLAVRVESEAKKR